MSIRAKHNVFLKRKLIPTPVERVAPPPSVDELPSTDKVSTELYRPRTMADIFGNSQMKQRIKSWMQSGGTTLCCISGPVGCGKTSLARVVMMDAGREIVDLRTSPDMFTILTDMLNTPHRKPMGVIIDEIENLTPAHRSNILKIITKRNPSIPIICICTDASNRDIRTFVKACGTHIQMSKPSAVIAGDVVRRVAPRLDSASRDSIAMGSNGDLRQATILAHQARVERQHREVIMERRERVKGKYPSSEERPVRSADRRLTNVFDASRLAFHVQTLDMGVEVMQYDTLVPMMVQDAMVGRMYTVPRVQGPNTKQGIEQEYAQLTELTNRLDFMCDGDVLDSHDAHNTHHYAHHQYANGILGFKSRRNAPNPTFPKSLGIATRRRGNESVITDVMCSRFRSTRTDPMKVQLTRLMIKQNPKIVKDKGVLKKFNSIKF
jgi:DNA polymerase III delta prime subunit